MWSSHIWSEFQNSKIATGASNIIVCSESSQKVSIEIYSKDPKKSSKIISIMDDFKSKNFPWKEENGKMKLFSLDHEIIVKPYVI